MDVTSWYFWFGTFTGLALLIVVALPFSLLVMGALALRRRSRGAATAWRTSLTDVGIVHGTLPWVWMTMLPGSRAGAAPVRVSPVPLEDLLVMGWPGIVGNLLIFAALGFFVPMRVRALASLPRILALAGGCSVMIEVAQYVLALDRVSSVDDVLLNAAGAGVAALASRRWWLSRSADEHVERQCGSGEHQEGRGKGERGRAVTRADVGHDGGAEPTGPRSPVRRVVPSAATGLSAGGRASTTERR